MSHANLTSILSLKILNLFIILLNLFVLVASNSAEEKEAAFIVSNGRYYVNYNKKIKTDSDLTGTGNRLRDVAYISTCMSLKCENVCCEGDISNMKCGSKESCVSLRNTNIEVKLIQITLGLLICYLMIPIGLCVTMFLEYKKSKAYNIFSKIFNVYSGILIPPYGIAILFEFLCQKKNINGNKEKKLNVMKNSSENDKLFKNKFFQAQDFQNGAMKVNDFNIKNEEGKDFDMNSDFNLREGKRRDSEL